MYPLLACIASAATCGTVAEIDLGGQPDSVAVSPDNSFAAIAIENERDEEACHTTDGVLVPGPDDSYYGEDNEDNCTDAGFEFGRLPQPNAGWLAVIDDTLNNLVGRKICGAATQHDGAAPKTGKPVGYGVCFVTIGLAVRLPGISDRVFCLPFAARLWWPKKAKTKPKGARYKTKTQLAAQLIKLTRSCVILATTPILSMGSRITWFKS